MSKLAEKIEGNHFLMAIYEVGCQVSRIFNFGLGGSPDETFSFRVAKNEGNCKVCNTVCKIVDFLDPGHCAHSIQWWHLRDEFGKDHRPLWPWVAIWGAIVYFFVW